MTKGPSQLWRIENREFVAGVIVKNDRVLTTAPILAFMRGWPFTRVETHCKERGWSLNRPRRYKNE